MIKNEEMVSPDALICNDDGFIWPAMFHFLPSECDAELVRETAREHGFEIRGYYMDDDDPLYQEYADGSHLVVGKWQPEVPDGWQLGGKHDTEDGPYVFFLRKLKTEDAVLA